MSKDTILNRLENLPRRVESVTAAKGEQDNINASGWGNWDVSKQYFCSYLWEIIIVIKA